MASPLERLAVSRNSRPPSTIERSFYHAFVTELVARRKRARVTQEQLDVRLGCTSGQVAKWETFQRLPGAFMLMCWCKALDCSLSVVALQIEEQDQCAQVDPAGTASSTPMASTSMASGALPPPKPSGSAS